VIYSKLELFINDGNKLDKYRQAIRLLDECGAGEVLRELSAATILSPDAPNRMELAAASHFETRGYQKCLYDLFSLEQIKETTQKALNADYGALERMEASGEITADQAKELREREYG
jgi:hypothetical protein